MHERLDCHCRPQAGILAREGKYSVSVYVGILWLLMKSTDTFNRVDQNYRTMATFVLTV